jgi:hypothetical protein
VLGWGATELLTLAGIFMPPIHPAILLGVAGTGVIYFVGFDWLKVRLLAGLALR